MAAFGMEPAATDAAPLPGSTRGKIEGATGADLGAVTVHSGAEGAAVADAHDARAVAVGQQIHVGAGERLDGADGEHLLAHEVAHTMQARNSGQASTRAAAKPLTTTSPDSAAEVEADRFADAISSGRAPAPIVEPLHADAARTPRGHHKKKSTTPDVNVDAKAAPLVASTEELTFEPTVLGQDSPLQTITITNAGAEPVTIENVTAGAAEAVFPTYTSSGLDAAIDAGASVALQFGFRPQKEGPAKALYQVVTDGGITSLILRLAGRGVSDQRSEAPPDKPDNHTKPADDKSVAIGPISGTAEVKSSGDWHDYLPWNDKSNPGMYTATNTAIDAAKELESAKYDYGLLVGFDEGLHKAGEDLKNSVVELGKLVYKVLTNDYVSLALDVSKKLEALMQPGLLSRLGKWFVDGWTNPDDYSRGEFRGEVVGYITVQIVAALATQGAAAEVAATGVFAEVLNVLKGTDALEEVTAFGESVAGADQAAQVGVNSTTHVPPEVPAVPEVPEVTPQPEVTEAPRVEPQAPETKPETQAPETKKPEPEPPERSKKPQPETKPVTYPKSWSKFDPANNEAFRLRLRDFRGNDDLAENFSGGEGRIFKADGQNVALKRWFNSRLGDMSKSLQLLRDARASVSADAELSEVMDVVAIHEEGPDWILRDFDEASTDLAESGDAAASNARARAIARLEELQKEGKLSSVLKSLLKKLKKEPPSANLHWSVGTNKILVIDMQ